MASAYRVIPSALRPRSAICPRAVRFAFAFMSPSCVHARILLSPCLSIGRGGALCLARLQLVFPGKDSPVLARSDLIFQRLLPRDGRGRGAATGSSSELEDGDAVRAELDALVLTVDVVKGDADSSNSNLWYVQSLPQHLVIQHSVVTRGALFTRGPDTSAALVLLPFRAAWFACQLGRTLSCCPLKR